MKTGPGGGPLEGAEFELKGNKGTTLTGTSDRDGKVVWTALPADEQFTLEETKAPDGCQVIAPQNITLTGGQTTYLTVPNDAEKGFTIKKIDAQNKSSLQGAVFRFEQIDGDYTTTGITGFDGQISFEGDALPYPSSSKNWKIVLNPKSAPGMSATKRSCPSTLPRGWRAGISMECC